MRSIRPIHIPYLLSAFALLLSGGAWAQGPKRAALSEAEVDKLRDTQEPGERIKVYLDFMQRRLTTFDTFRNKPVNPEYRGGKYLDEILGQYVALDDELKDWIQYQYNRQGDMRAGLRTLLDTGPQQLEELRHVQQSRDPYFAHYSDTLQDAIADMQDTLDGASTAMAAQVKTLGELKQKEKETAQASKEAIKQEKKQLKQERKLEKKEEKLQKKEAKQQNDSGADDDN
ncbi:MAG TPA: hypothetical protein VMI06_02545 [Terriglobia bacterium]|nr:hypothetical protein [Terriglobia bacterium]